MSCLAGRQERLIHLIAGVAVLIPSRSARVGEGFRQSPVDLVSRRALTITIVGDVHVLLGGSRRYRLLCERRRRRHGLTRCRTHVGLWQLVQGHERHDGHLAHGAVPLLNDQKDGVHLVKYAVLCLLPWATRHRLKNLVQGQ